MDVVLSLVVLVAIGLVAGAIVLWRRGAPLKQVLLMIGLAVIMAINVGIWTLPNSEGQTLLDQDPGQ